MGNQDVFRSLRVTKDALLPVTNLERLGHINVICGRNNAGKSTLLAAIASESSGWTTQVEAPVIARFLGELERHYCFQGLPARENTTRIAEEYFRDKPVLSSYLAPDDIDGFVRAMALQGWGLSNQNQIQPLWGQVLIPRPRIALIPSPRMVAVTGSGVNPHIGTQTDGGSLLNGLLVLRNSSQTGQGLDRFAEIQNAFSTVTEGFRFHLHWTSGNTVDLEVLPPDGARWISANEAGIGLRDVLVMLYWTTAPDLDVLLIEEPESHLHPSMQRRLLQYLTGVNKQFFLSTHSNVFLDTRYIASAFRVTYQAGQITAEPVTSKLAALRDLGYSPIDNLAPDCVVLVEGPSDWQVIEEFLAKMSLLEKYDIRHWILGGDAMAQLDLAALAAQSNVHALVDRDPKSGRIRDSFIASCQAANIKVTQLQRYSIENYFSIEALKAVFKGQFPSEVTHISPDEKLSDQLHIDVKANNRKIAAEMSLADLEGTDLSEFLHGVQESLHVGQVSVN